MSLTPHLGHFGGSPGAFTGRFMGIVFYSVKQ